MQTVCRICSTRLCAVDIGTFASCISLPPNSDRAATFCKILNSVRQVKFLTQAHRCIQQQIVCACAHATPI